MERPQNKNLKPFKPKGEKPMEGRLFVRVTSELEQVVRSLPDSPEWLRRVISEAARRELLGKSQGGTASEKATPSPPPDSLFFSKPARRRLRIRVPR